MEYFTLKSESQGGFVEKKSRFIGYACPVSSEAGAQNFIEKISKKHWDARHNVYAYIIRKGSQSSGITRYSDNGEPAGTAGIPVLSVLEKGGISDACIVVTRYFGGILLGASSLARAYSHAASLAVKSSGISHMQMCSQGRMTCDYSGYGRVSALLPEHGAVVDDVVYTDVVEIYFHVPAEGLQNLVRILADVTCGTAEIAVTGEQFYLIDN